MLQKFLSLWLGIFFVSITGTLFHFVYEWSGNNRIAGLFTPVNESIWEHMKLLFFPMLLYFFIESLFFRNPPTAISTGIAILIGTLLIPVLFYTYSGILGYHVAVIDILIFFFSVFCSFQLRYSIMQSGKYSSHFFLVFLGVFLGVFLLFLCFLLFTYNPPDLGIFRVPTR